MNEKRRTVAMAITKVALLEHCAMSSSSCMIFLTRETGIALGAVSENSLARPKVYLLGRALCPVISSGSGTTFGDITKCFLPADFCVLLYSIGPPVSRSGGGRTGRLFECSLFQARVLGLRKVKRAGAALSYHDSVIDTWHWRSLDPAIDSTSTLAWSLLAILTSSGTAYASDLPRCALCGLSPFKSVLHLGLRHPAAAWKHH